MTKDEPLNSIEEFFFGAPLYKAFSLPKDDDYESYRSLYGVHTRKISVDGYCPYCRRASTFYVGEAYVPSRGMLDEATEDLWSDVVDETHTHVSSDDSGDAPKRAQLDAVSITCVRNDLHKIHYYILRSGMTVQKIGQFPSVADISNDEVAQYRKGMTEEDAREFHKAIGLAAHGVGVGSFVYLRRVFERLINGRYEEFKEAEGWKDEDFFGLKMSDRVKMLKDHLPEFLVENAKIYSILSTGIHDLDEDTCLGYFDVMKHSIIIILEEDKKKKEELELKGKLSKAISAARPGAQK